MPTEGPIFERKKHFHRNYKADVRRARRNKNNFVKNKLAEKLVSRNGKHFWKDVRKIMGDKRPTATSIDGVTGDKDIAELWKVHYEKIFNCFPDNELRTNDFSYDPSAIVTPREIYENISRIKCTNSPGPDGISAEHLKFASIIICDLLANCFSAIFIHGSIPRDMLDVHIVPVVKDNRSSLSKMDNYRPIATASCISKLLELSILSRIESKIHTTENQFGYKKGLGTDSCIFLLKEIINRFKSSNTNTFLAFLDASKAFDKVRHDILFSKMNDAGIPPFITRVLKYWYSNQSLFVKWNGCVSDPFGSTNGVKQGGMISPYLFNFYVNNLSVRLNSLNIGCYLDRKINNILYADDLILISPTRNGLQKLISECEIFSQAHSVEFNVKKSKTMIIPAQRYKDFDFSSIFLNKKALEKVSSFKYLGHIISDDTRDDSDIMRHCRYLYAVGNSLIRKFWYCNLTVKLKLFKIYCGNVYSGQLWSNYSAASISKVTTAYNTILRRLLNIPRFQDGVSYSASAMFTS